MGTLWGIENVKMERGPTRGGFGSCHCRSAGLGSQGLGMRVLSEEGRRRTWNNKSGLVAEKSTGAEVQYLLQWVRGEFL